MPAKIEFLAIYVPDLKQAEQYYGQLFDMEVITREAEKGNGLWYALPKDKGWDEVEKAGMELGMLAMRRDDFVLAMFPCEPIPGQLFTVGLSMAGPELDKIAERVPEDDILEYCESDILEFKDKFGYPWQLYATPYRFKSAGEFAGRWLELP